MAEVEMYGTGVCPYCVAARQLFAAKGVEFTDIRVDHEPQKRTEMRQRGGGQTVPQIWIGEVYVGGYDDLAALDRAGKLDVLLAV